MSWFWRGVHIAVIGLLLLEVAYCGFQLLVVWRPEGAPLILGSTAAHVPFETLVARRMYAIEGWFALIGLALYLGMTEILPRRLAARR